MKPITLVHLITELNMGGAEQMLHKLVTRMDRKRFRSVVVSMTDRGPIGEKILEQGIPVIHLGMTLGRPSLGGSVKLLHTFKRLSADMVQTWLYHADLMGLILGKVASVKRIIWGIRCSDMHLRNYNPLTALTVWLAGILSPLPAAIVVNSEEGRKVHQNRGYYTGRMVLIPNGFDMREFHPDESARDWLLEQLDLPPDVTLIGLVARFDPMKDQKNFLRAASILAEKERSAHFVMVGRGMVPDNKDLARLLGHRSLRGRVHLLGLRFDTPRIMAALDVGASSSAFGEGFSNTIGETMSCGVPCVITDVGDSARIVGDTGIVVPPRDPEALAGAWQRLIKAGAVARKELGNRARARIEENFEIGKVVHRFEELYEQIMDSC